MGLLSRMLGKRDPERAQKFLTEGVLAAREGRLADALRAYQRAVKADPEDVVARTNEGIALLDLYNRDHESLDADDARTRLLAIESTLESATLMEGATLAAFRALGHCSMRLHHFVGAQAAFASAFAMLEDEHPQRDVLGPLRNEAKRLAERDAALERAARAAAFDDTEDEERIAAAQGLVPVLLDDDAPADAWWAAGALARRAKNLDVARSHYENCLVKAPHHDRARRELATLCMNTGDMAAALEHSLVAYQADPIDAGRVCNVGVCHLALGNRAKAEEFLELARELAPDDVIVARAYEKLSEKEESNDA